MPNSKGSSTSSYDLNAFRILCPGVGDWYDAHYAFFANCGRSRLCGLV